MAESFSAVYSATLTEATEEIVANDTELVPKVGNMAQGVDTQNCRRLTVICDNKSEGSAVTFNVRPAPGKVDPDTSIRIFVDASYTATVPAGEIRVIDIATYHPFVQVTATPASAGTHPVVVYIDGFIDNRG